MATRYLHIGQDEKRITVLLMGDQQKIDEVAAVLKAAFEVVEVHTRLHEPPYTFNGTEMPGHSQSHG